MNIGSLSSTQHSFHSASIQRQSQPTITTVTGASGYSQSGTADMMNNIDSARKGNTQLANVNASQSNPNYTFNQLA